MKTEEDRQTLPGLFPAWIIKKMVEVVRSQEEGLVCGVRGLGASE